MNPNISKATKDQTLSFLTKTFNKPNIGPVKIDNKRNLISKKRNPAIFRPYQENPNLRFQSSRKTQRKSQCCRNINTKSS